MRAPALAGGRPGTLQRAGAILACAILGVGAASGRSEQEPARVPGDHVTAMSAHESVASTAAAITAALASLPDAEFPSVPVFEPVNPRRTSAPPGTLVLNPNCTFRRDADRPTPIRVFPSPDTLGDVEPPDGAPAAFLVEFRAGRASDTGRVLIPTPAGTRVPAKVHDRLPEISRDVGRTVGTDDRWFRSRIEALKPNAHGGADITRVVRTTAIDGSIVRAESLSDLDDTSPSDSWTAYPLLEANGPARFEGFYKHSTTAFEIPFELVPDDEHTRERLRIPIADTALPSDSGALRRQGVEFLTVPSDLVANGATVVWVEQHDTNDYPRIRYTVRSGLPPEPIDADERTIAMVAVFDSITDDDLATLIARLSDHEGSLDSIRSAIALARGAPE